MRAIAPLSDAGTRVLGPPWLVIALALALVIVAVVVIVIAATARFHAKVDREVRALEAIPHAAAGVVGADELARLPAPVARWLERAGVVGRERAVTVRLTQRGRMHTANDAPWMEIQAEQLFTADEPAFIWRMDTTMFGVLPLTGRDAYVDGRGEMLVLAGGLVPVANERGPKIDQGAMLRFLAELMWFPSAALRPYLAWEPIDATHAKATMTNGGVTASAVFTFDDLGRVLDVEARRYFGASGGLERWGGRTTEWRTVRGVEIPVRGDVVWRLSSGDFTFFRYELVDVETNPRPALARPREAGPRSDRVPHGGKIPSPLS